jgi:hypothetical protein
VRRALIAGLAFAALGGAACGYADPYTSTGVVANESPVPTTSPSPSPGVDDFNAGAGMTVVRYPDGLQYIDLKVGTGATAVSGENATVEYTGWLTTGVVFDSSRARPGNPFTFQLGAKAVIVGWDEGIPGMKVGGKRKLTLPPALGYGANAQTNPTTKVVTIPANSTLVFEVELMSLAPGPSPTPLPTPTPSPSPSPTPT